MDFCSFLFFPFGRLWLSLGGFHEVYDETSKEHSSFTPDAQSENSDIVHYFNTHILVDDHGSIVATYRKIHLFDVDVDGGFRESKYTVPGSQVVLVKDTPFGNIGLSTCYDMRFPELYTLYGLLGADLILVPSAFMPTTGKAHWEVLLSSRAIETQCYVAAAAQYGQHNEKRGSHGHALIADPWGKVVGECVADVRCVWVFVVQL